VRGTEAARITGRQAGAGARDQVADWVVGTIATAGGEVAGLRVRLEPAARGLTVGQVNLVCFDRALRVQAAAAHPEEVGLRLIERLARQVALFSRGWTPRPWPDPLAAPPPNLECSPRVARHKIVQLAVTGVPEAVAVLDARDYQAHLFTDAECGLDAVVYRGSPGGYRLARTSAAAPGILPRAALATSPRSAPLLTVGAACARLSEGAVPFVFFTDRATGRGALLYPRYAGGCASVASGS